MDWKQKLQSARDAGQSNVTGAANVILDEQWPKIQQIFAERIGPAAIAAAQNEQAMQSLFRTAYSVLPFPVRMVVKEDVFVAFCSQHRTRLLPSGEQASQLAGSDSAETEGARPTDGARPETGV